jgi:ADP-glucose pyrophosphorylase
VACDRPRDYLDANLAWSGGAPVVGAGAVVEGELVRSVVWPGATVHAHEVLVDAIRIDDRTTVLVR